MKRQLILMTLTVLIIGMGVLPAGASHKKACQARFGGARQLKAAFQSDEGKVRLVALVSPT